MMSRVANASEANFLGHLVDKSLGRANVVQPRLPSLFEPAAPGGDAVGLVARDERAEPAEGPRVEAPLVRPRDRAPVAPSPWEAESGEEQTFATRMTEAAGSRPMQPLSERFFHPPEDASVRERTAVRAFAAESTSPFPPSLERPMAGGVKHVVVPSPHPQTGSASADEPAVKKAIDGEVLTGLRYHSRDRQEMQQHVAVAHRSSRDPIMPSGALLPRQRPEVYETPSLATQSPRVSPIAREQRRTSGSAPVINVTIGRVEVRAMQQPLAGRAPTARSAQPMSLGDYLHRREGRQ
jgi:hypothetical protein